MTEPYRSLACAIVHRAINDLKHDEHKDDATTFLRSRWCACLLESLGIDVGAVLDRVAPG